MPSRQKLPGTFCHKNTFSSNLFHYFSIAGVEEAIGAFFARNFAGFCQKYGKELLAGGYAMIQSSSALSGQNGALPPEVLEQSLAPLLEKWRKEFETLLSSLKQGANTNRSQVDTTKGA